RAPGAAPANGAPRHYEAGRAAIAAGNARDGQECFARAVVAARGAGDGLDVVVPLAASYFELGRLATSFEAVQRFEQSARLFTEAAALAREDGRADLAERLERQAATAEEQARAGGAEGAGPSAGQNLLQPEKELRAREAERGAAPLG